jgi:PLP dependent protein
VTDPPDRTRVIAARRGEIEARIAAACERAGRDPADVTLVAVTKTHPVASIAAALAAGLTHFGENRVQELAAKRAALPEASATWHLIGHVQTNKARDAVRSADLVHGVDSARLAEALARRAEADGRRLPVLVQVNVSGEASKQGCSPEDAAALVAVVAALPELHLDGLMTLAAPADDPETIRPQFRLLRTLRDRLQTPDLALPVLSMGMSGDYEVAVEEGATHVRIGTALFGAR